MQEEYASDAINALRNDTAEGRFLLNVEYKVYSLYFTALFELMSNMQQAYDHVYLI